MKALMLSIHANWLQMILSGEKKFEFRDWKKISPEKMKELIGMTIYFYCSKAKPLLYWSSGGYADNLGPISSGPYLIGDGVSIHDVEEDDILLNGKVVAKCVVKDVLDLSKDTHMMAIESTGASLENWGYNGQRYALQLSQVEAIEPKDVTEFVSWNKLDNARKQRNKCSDIQEALRNGDWQEEYDTVKKYVDYYGADYLHLTKPPQSRVWIYVEEE